MAHTLFCPKDNKHYPPGSGQYCPQCGTPLIELEKPEMTRLQKVRAAINAQVGNNEFPFLRFISNLVMGLGISLVILSFVLPPMLITTTRTMINSLQVSDGAGGNGPLPIYQDVANGPSVVLAVVVWALMFVVGIGTTAGAEFIKLFIRIHDELAGLKNTVQHISLLLVSDEP